MADPHAPGTRRYKVERIGARYGLDALVDTLAARWTGEGGEPASLRDLAREMNLQILQRAIDDSHRTISTPELKTIYAILRGDKGTSADRTKVRRDLERDGVDVAQLEADFVTHQAIHTYLTKGEGVRKSTPEADPIARSQETVDRLRSRTAAVATSELERLARREDLELGAPEVIVSVTVTCRKCGTFGELATILENGGCDC